jgi:hypothetical protein
METIVKIHFNEATMTTGFIHLNENHKIMLFTDDNGNELTEYTSWYVPEEV